MAATMHDSSKLHQPERLIFRMQQLEELSALLENRLLYAEERIQELEELLYRQSQRALLGEMVMTLGHHWRQPLNNISLLVQTMQLRTREMAEVARYLDEMMHIVQEMSGTMSQLLGTFQQEQCKQAIALPKTIRECVELAREFLKCGPITFEVHAEEGLSSFGSRNELMQAVLSAICTLRNRLLEKRIESPTITIRAAREGGGGVIRIRDNSCSAHHPQDETQAPGWQLCRAAIEQGLGGKCQVLSTATGREVSFRLPLGTSGTRLPALPE